MAEIVVRSNNIENIVLGRLTALWNASGSSILRYHLDARHTKMNLHRELSAPEILFCKARLLVRARRHPYRRFRPARPPRRPSQN